MTKIKIPIKNEAMIFLNDVCISNGLFEMEPNIETTKNKATVKYIEKDRF